MNIGVLTVDYITATEQMILIRIPICPPPVAKRQLAPVNSWLTTNCMRQHAPNLAKGVQVEQHNSHATATVANVRING